MRQRYRHELRVYVSADLYERLVREAASRRITVSECVRTDLKEFYAIKDELMAPLEAACARNERDRASIEVSTLWIPGLEPVDGIDRYSEIGVDRLVVPYVVVTGGGDPIEGLKRFGDEVMAKLGAPGQA